MGNSQVLTQQRRVWLHRCADLTAQCACKAEPTSGMMASRTGFPFIVLIAFVACSAVRANAMRHNPPLATMHRGLLYWPLVLPQPFENPKQLADSLAAAAASPGGLKPYSSQMCQAFASPANQGTRNFKDIQGVKIFPMMQNVAMAAYGYPDDFANRWGAILATCNSMQMAAEGVGYAIAFIYSEGIVNALGVTKMLEAAFKQGGGCTAVDVILNVAAAVLDHDDRINELAQVMKSYSAVVAPCVPQAADAKFKPYNPVALAITQQAKSQQVKAEKPKSPAGATRTASMDVTPKAHAGH